MKDDIDRREYNSLMKDFDGVLESFNCFECGAEITAVCPYCDKEAYEEMIQEEKAEEQVW